MDATTLHIKDRFALVPFPDGLEAVLATLTDEERSRLCVVSDSPGKMTFFDRFAHYGVQAQILAAMPTMPDTHIYFVELSTHFVLRKTKISRFMGLLSGKTHFTIFNTQQHDDTPSNLDRSPSYDYLLAELTLSDPIRGLIALLDTERLVWLNEIPPQNKGNISMGHFQSLRVYPNDPLEETAGVIMCYGTELLESFQANCTQSVLDSFYHLLTMSKKVKLFGSPFQADLYTKFEQWQDDMSGKRLPLWRILDLEWGPHLERLQLRAHSLENLTITSSGYDYDDHRFDDEEDRLDPKIKFILAPQNCTEDEIESLRRPLIDNVAIPDGITFGLEFNIKWPSIRSFRAYLGTIVVSSGAVFHEARDPFKNVNRDEDFEFMKPLRVLVFKTPTAFEAFGQPTIPTYYNVEELVIDTDTPAYPHSLTKVWDNDDIRLLVLKTLYISLPGQVTDRAPKWRFGRNLTRLTFHDNRSGIVTMDTLRSISKAMPRLEHLDFGRRYWSLGHIEDFEYGKDKLKREAALRRKRKTVFQFKELKSLKMKFFNVAVWFGSLHILFPKLVTFEWYGAIPTKSWEVVYNALPEDPGRDAQWVRDNAELTLPFVMDAPMMEECLVACGCHDAPYFGLQVQEVMPKLKKFTVEGFKRIELHPEQPPGATECAVRDMSYYHGVCMLDQTAH